MRSRFCIPALLVLAGTAAGCGVPERFALPVPIPLTQGATTVPAQGAGGLVEFGDGLGGQELLRTEVLAPGIVGAVGDRVSLSFHPFTETRGNQVDGVYLRAKVRAGPVFGPRSSVGVAFSVTASERSLGDVQDERVRSFDLAVPSELLLTSSDDQRLDLSGYLAPRIVVERYDDRLDPAQTLHTTHWGALAGLHGRLGHLHLFAELTLLHLAGRTVRGATLGSDWMAIPALGVALHFGPPHRWGRPAT